MDPDPDPVNWTPKSLAKRLVPPYQTGCNSPAKLIHSTVWLGMAISSTAYRFRYMVRRLVPCKFPDPLCFLGNPH